MFLYLRRVCFARIESHPDILRIRVSDHFLHSIDSHQRFAQGANAFVAIIPISRDIDSLPDGVISGVVEIMRIGWVHLLNFARRNPSECMRAA